MNLLLKEYLSSCDKEEAVYCLKELEVPHFHHEMVYEAVVMVLEKADQSSAEKMCALLQYMARINVITPDQFNKVRKRTGGTLGVPKCVLYTRMALFTRGHTCYHIWECSFSSQGFLRVFHDLTDIVLDAPNAYHTLSKFVDSGIAAGFVSKRVSDELPSRCV